MADFMCEGSLTPEKRERIRVFQETGIITARASPKSGVFMI